MTSSRYVGLLTFVTASILPSGVLALWPIPTNLDTGTTIRGGWPSPALSRNRPTGALAGAKTLSSLKLSLASSATVEPIASEAVKPLGTRSEEYGLTIPADGSTATLIANLTLALYRGLTTFNQLFYCYGGVTYTLLAQISITDTLEYPFRKPALDTLGDYYPVTDILRTLDAMSWVKINTFHWHITDSQSFPLEVSRYPELAMNGAYSAAEVYTESDIQYIVQYARARGIDVLIDNHTNEALMLLPFTTLMCK